MIRTVVKDAGGKIIRALTQWDYGQTVYLTNSHVDQAYDVHWAKGPNADTTDNVETEYDDGTLSIPVPDSYLQSTGKLVGYVYADDGESGQTVISFVLDVIPRPMPGDLVAANSDDYINASTILAAVESASAAAAESATAAAESATAAAESATAAAESATAAEESATAAAESATAAAESAASANAYSYAVAGGYEGTEDEFASAMAIFAALINAEEVAY